MKEGKRIYENTHPEVVKSKDKNMPTHESDQRHRTERTKRWSNETEDISKKMNLNGSQTSDLPLHEILRKKSISKEADTIHYEEKKEVAEMSSKTVSDMTEHVDRQKENERGEADTDFFKERRKVVALNSSITSDLAAHEDLWEKSSEAYPCEEGKEVINKDIPAASGLVSREDLWERHVRRKADNYSREEKKESVSINDLDAKKKIMFRPGRDPKEAIEGDLIRFLHRNRDNSVSWLEGRLVGRIDKLEDAIRSNWTTNRFTVDISSTINHWGDPGSPPPSTTVNISYGTKWALGIEGNHFSDTDMILHLGYLEATCMDLTGREFGSGGLNEERPIAMNHTYEISLLAPGEGLQDISDCFAPLHESEGIMREIMLNNVTAKGKEEIGILSVITEQRLIRRAYLNDTMIKVKIDTCSLASVVVTKNPKLSRIIRIKRKVRTQPLTQTSQRFHKCMQRVRQEHGPGSTVDKERMGEISKEAFRSGPKFILASDDPRRGGRVGDSDKREEGVNPSSTSQRQIVEDCRENDSQFPNDGEATGSWKTGANVYEDTNASATVVMTPQAKWEDELSSPAPRQVHRSAHENTHGTGGPTRKKDMRNRIPWWPELINKKKGHDVGTGERNNACRLRDVEDMKLIDSIFTM